ncbi:MAG: hypothetical protein J6Y89_08430 [Lachnospiraceae bacterium]|nr:hypothetical protein [Lachnospiraceae bacterium]
MYELKELLIKVRDSYFDFVVAMLVYAEKKPSRCDLLIKFLKSNPDANSSDVVKFVSEQPDFFEDAAPLNVG